MPVVTSPAASRRVRAAAADLAESLGRVCGRPFKVETGDGSRGLALGTARDFPALKLEPEFDAAEPMRREQYLLRSRAGGLLAAGATDAAVEAAVADLLHRAGWRRYFPGPSWEIVPRRPDLSLALDVKTAPSFAARRIWYGFGQSDHNRRGFEEWQRRNRVPGAFNLQTGHMFESFIERHKAEFHAHPEYLALVNGRRSSSKLCLSNPDLRRLMVDSALERIGEDPARDTLSLEPSDGDGWCECARCRAAGSPSDRLLTLANELSEKLEQGHPGKYAAFYAYNLHSPPPKGRVRERVIVTVATSYLPRGHTPEEVLEGWRRQGASLMGLREYYGIFQWHRSLPARMKGGDLAYLSASLPKYHAMGVRLVSAESGEDWGANGLGYYAASRIMWDIAESSRTAEIREEFLSGAFGGAKEPMRGFYDLIDGGRSLRGTAVPAALVEGMYQRLREAEAATDDPAVRARLDDLVLYTRYVELHEAYRASVLGRQTAFDSLVRHARRMKGRMMVHLRALRENAARGDRLVSVPEDDGAPEYGAEDAAALLRAGAGSASR